MPEWLFSEDQRHNNWILYRDSMKTGRSLRQRYAGLPCPRCKKFDELAAVRSGIDSDVAIRSQSDLLHTHDGFICVSRLARDLLQSRNVQGCEFLSLPGDEHYSLCFPMHDIPVDIESSDMRFHRRCGVCGRFGETTGWPSLRSMAIPTSPNAMYIPNISLENSIARSMLPLVTGDVADALRTERLTGIEFIAAD